MRTQLPLDTLYLRVITNAEFNRRCKLCCNERSAERYDKVRIGGK